MEYTLKKIIIFFLNVHRVDNNELNIFETE